MTRPKQLRTSTRTTSRIASRGETNRRILSYRRKRIAGKLYVYHATKGWRPE